MENEDIIQNGISSGIFLVCWILLKFAVSKSISNWKFKEIESRRKWMVQIRNLMFFGLVLGLMLIWASALKTFALSIVVIASAIAIGCKEYIMCFLGGLLKAGSNHFSIGDRITIGHYRGDVINHTPFTTTLFEVGPGEHFHQYTGSKITIPNSVLLTTSVVNETHGSKYTLHTFQIKVPRDSDWHDTKKRILEAANEVCSSHVKNAQGYFNHLARKRDIDAPNAEPKVFVGLHDEDSVEFVVRVPALSKDVGKTEQEIIERAFKV